MIQINSIVDTIIYLLVMTSGITALILQVYPKRYYGELAVAIFTLTLFLTVIRIYLNTSISSTTLLPIIALIMVGLAFVASSVRLVRKIKKRKYET